MDRGSSPLPTELVRTATVRVQCASEPRQGVQQGDEGEVQDLGCLAQSGVASEGVAPDGADADNDLGFSRLRSRQGPERCRMRMARCTGSPDVSAVRWENSSSPPPDLSRSSVRPPA